VSRDPLLYLDDIVQATEKIQRTVTDLSFEAFCDNEVYLDAVLFNLQVIGEAAKKLPPDILAGMPDIEWSEAAKFRDIIAHHYFALDTEIIWDVVTKRIPEIREASHALLARLDSV